jgi:hypothetical protein
MRTRTIDSSHHDILFATNVKIDLLICSRYCLGGEHAQGQHEIGRRQRDLGPKN